jgi:RNA polymerase sigma-70 factor (ECF subfamily)
VEEWLAVEQTSPSQGAEQHEETLRLAEALAKLSDAQREVLVLQHWEGWSLAQIGEKMGRTPAAVAGLIKRGMKRLREQLREGETRDD